MALCGERGTILTHSDLRSYMVYLRIFKHHISVPTPLYKMLDYLTFEAPLFIVLIKFIQCLDIIALENC